MSILEIEASGMPKYEETICKGQYYLYNDTTNEMRGTELQKEA